LDSSEAVLLAGRYSTAVSGIPEDFIYRAGTFGHGCLYFLLNTWLIAWAVALDKHTSAIRVWQKEFQLALAKLF
jgi:hypothetical protein